MKRLFILSLFLSLGLRSDTIMQQAIGKNPNDLLNSEWEAVKARVKSKVEGLNNDGNKKAVLAVLNDADVSGKSVGEKMVQLIEGLYSIAQRQPNTVGGEQFITFYNTELAEMKKFSEKYPADKYQEDTLKNYQNIHDGKLDAILADRGVTKKSWKERLQELFESPFKVTELPKDAKKALKDMNKTIEKNLKAAKTQGNEKGAREGLVDGMMQSVDTALKAYESHIGSVGDFGSRAKPETDETVIKGAYDASRNDAKNALDKIAELQYYKQAPTAAQKGRLEALGVSGEGVEAINDAITRHTVEYSKQVNDMYKHKTDLVHLQQAKKRAEKGAKKQVVDKPQEASRGRLR